MNPLLEILASEARKCGVISFARFMELALYCPVCGYYEREADTIGRRGDYYTSVSVGNLFGELLAFQFADWLEPAKGRTPKLTIVEAGAHDGTLARDILSWLHAQRRQIFEQLEYLIVDPSARRRRRQAETLAVFEKQIRWVSQLKEMAETSPGGSVRGIIFANELLDALPVHRLGWDAAEQTWFEWGVACNAGQFTWAKMPRSEILGCNASVPALPPGLKEILPDGFIAEICPMAESWWREAAGILRGGKLLTLDYGLSAEELFSPERSWGTLRAYHRHQAGGDLLADPGEQDLTAHVNFAAIQRAGESAGLKTEAFVRQANFLVQIVERVWKQPSGFGEWSAARTRQFQTLTHPEHLGRPFRVLIQSR